MQRIILVLLLICICYSCGPSESKHVLVPCNVAGYLFALGEPVSETKKNWSYLKEYSFRFSYNPNIQLFSDTYEEHAFSFTFYNNELIRADLTFPQSELNPAIIKVGENTIPVNTTLATLTFVDDLNCMISCSPFEFEGMKDIQIIIEYKDTEELLSNGMDE